MLGATRYGTVDAFASAHAAGLFCHRERRHPLAVHTLSMKQLIRAVSLMFYERTVAPSGRIMCLTALQDEMPHKVQGLGSTILQYSTS